MEIIFLLVATIFAILWGILVVVPVTEMGGLDPIVALTQILINPYFFIMVVCFIIGAIIYWIRRGEGIEFNPITFKKALIQGILGFFIALGLGILFLIIFGQHGFFNDLATVIESFTGPHPVMAYFLGSGLYSINATTPLLAPLLDAITPGIGGSVGGAAWPAFLTWLVTGFLLGFIAKKGKSALFGSLFITIFVWLFVVISARIIFLPPSIVGAAEFTIISLVMLPNVLLSCFYYVLGFGFWYLIFVEILKKYSSDD
ncbi:MAG: hypothetical protein ACFFD2_18185 [Promethearchaeota archaeon]